MSEIQYEEGYFEEFFRQRGEAIEANSQGEVIVKCPFPHDKGYENHASASFNREKRIYKCFTCTAEDRDKGMSEVSFVAKIYGCSYEDAVKLKSMKVDGSVDNLDKSVDNLFKMAPDLVDYLHTKRGLTDDTIKEYKLGYTGDGIVYPVILNGILVDTRTYNPNPDEGEPKIRSKKNAKALLFPYDQWVNSDEPTLMCAGENDTLLARQLGFNAVTTTLGEGSIPKMLLKKFSGRKVYVAYDCDEAGRTQSQRIGYYLKDAGAEVYIVDLGLQGTKEDKDITDYFMKHGKTAADLQALMSAAPLLTEEQYIEVKNKEYPLVDLWDVKKEQYSNMYISSRVMQMGHFELPQVDIPSHIEWACGGFIEGNKTCENCLVANRSGDWSLTSDNLKDLLKLVEVSEDDQNKAMKRLCGMPEKCPRPRLRKVAKKHVEKVLLAPDVETEDADSGYQLTESHAYVINGNTKDGEKYRMFFKRVPHPKNQMEILIVDKVEDSDNAINSFKVTDAFREAMKPWQGHPDVIMKKRYEELGKVAVGAYLPESIFYSSEIIYHSVIDMKFLGEYMKGHPEGLIIGASRTGKSEVGNKMSKFYGLGNVTECKNASVAGLIGGVDKSSNGTFRIAWGEIPRNHNGLLFLDEISGMPPEVFKHLTGLRSQREAVIAKIQKGKAPAKTRLLWVGNPRTTSDGESQTLFDYPNGVRVCKDLFPADEDISRFDFIVLVPEPDADGYISPLDENGNPPDRKHLPTELRELVRWVWSRKKDQVVFDSLVERYIENRAKQLNKEFGTSVKIIGVEGAKKIARIATSIAAACFSCTDDGESILVKQEHVDWVEKFLRTNYDNDVFRLREFVQDEQKTNSFTEASALEFANIAKMYPMLVRALLHQSDMKSYDLQISSGMESTDYRQTIARMLQSGLVTQTKIGYKASRRMRLCADKFKKDYKKKNLVKLSHEGGII